jgi:hypothetical protein
MFFPVTIYGPDGKIKKVISPKTLERRHWVDFGKMDKNRSFSSKARKHVPKQLKEKLDMGYFNSKNSYYN